MSRQRDWREYIDTQGDFELAKYLFETVKGLMKSSLDLGTLLSTDPVRLRAYKEQIKSTFKGQWLEMAQALESFDIIIPCGCTDEDFCRQCGGARYRLNSALSPDELREIAVVVAGEGDDLQEQLEKGLIKAIEEVKRLS